MLKTMFVFGFTFVIDGDGNRKLQYFVYGKAFCECKVKTTKEK